MRILILATCLALGGTSIAVADPEAPASPGAPAPATTPAAPAAAPTAAPPAAAPAAAAAATPADQAATAAAPTDTAFEKHLLAEGYKLEMRGGDKFYCKTEDNMLGSRLGNHRICSTAEQLSYRENSSQEYTQQLQRLQNNPTGH
jgi:hypothetical protein